MLHQVKKMKMLTQEYVQFAQNINKEDKPVLCVVLCKILHFGKYHTKKNY